MNVYALKDEANCSAIIARAAKARVTPRQVFQCQGCRGMGWLLQDHEPIPNGEWRHPCSFCGNDYMEVSPWPPKQWYEEAA